MKNKLYLPLLFLLLSNSVLAQSVNDIISTEKLSEDLTLFRSIREKANSGLYKYRSQSEIDSIYIWALKEIEKPKTILDFYKIICNLTNFEGSVHNETQLPDAVKKDIAASNGYFPYAVKLIANKLLINNVNNQIELGSEILAVNGVKTTEILKSLYKYYTTDGFNISGKSILINSNFAKYYRIEYGISDNFTIEYSSASDSKSKTITLKSITNSERAKNFNLRHSLKTDSLFYSKIDKEKYDFKILNEKTAVLTVKTFNIGGNSRAKEHKRYKKYLDDCFSELKKKAIQNLIVDIRSNGGGTDPNDILLFSYLANKKFRENKSAFINFQKIPFSEHLVAEEKSQKQQQKAIVGFEKELKDEFSIEKDGKFFQNEKFNPFIEPQKNAFNSNIYLLISPRIASAGSLFASLVEGNTEAITIGEETMGGYFGHNGHTPIAYELPNSKIVTEFSIVNLEQDVNPKKGQLYGSGILPDFTVYQNTADFLSNTDTVMNFTLELIKEKN